MKIGRTKQFKADFLKLPPDVRKAASQQIARLLIDHRHPSLRLEGITGQKGLFTVRINRRYRMSLEFDSEGCVLLRRILDHDDVYKKP